MSIKKTIIGLFVGVGLLCGGILYSNATVKIDTTKPAIRIDTTKPKLKVSSLQKGLVLDMPLTSKYTKDETVGSEIMTDRTPYNNDGQNSDATVGADYTTFDGTNDYIEITDDTSLDITDEITLSAWIKSSSVSEGVILSKLRPWDTPYGISLRGDQNGQIQGRFNLTDGNIEFNGNTHNINDDTWQHIIFTYDRINLKTYLNGVIDNTTAKTTAMTTTATNLFLSSDSFPAYFFDGDISGVKIYNRALSQIEITSLYNKGR